MHLSQISMIAAVALSFSAAADEPKTAPEPQRVILERHDQSAATGKEIVIGTATLPPGSSIGYHTHPGDEIGYVVKGTLIRKAKGEPDRTLRAGESFFNPRGIVHSVAAGSDGATVVSTWVIDKGQPLATPVP